MELKQTLKRLGALAAAGAVGMAGALAFASSAQAEESTLEINPGNVPTTAADFEDQSCDQVPGGEALEGQDGWVFVLPGQDGVFVSVTATFEDLDGAEHTLSTDGDEGGIDDGPGNGTSKAYIITPLGWTLTDATAVVEDATGDKFNLTHACPGEPGDGETTPPDDETTPPGDDETTPPGDDETSPGEASTSPAAGDQLPTTGTPLTVALVSAAALAAAGGALFFVMRRRRAAENW